ncbi:hypothetical protein S83_052846, partial [Arachis hypogaea]
MVICLRAVYPLLHVLRTVDLEEKLAMWFIYEEIKNDQHLKLQQFVIRVLNLICNSYGCEYNWSAFEM